MKGFKVVRWFLCFIVALVILFAGPATGKAEAAWSTDPTLNNAISTAANDQSTPTITSDGSGGEIITWHDYRSGGAIITWSDYRSGNYDIYAQRINASGGVQWTADGAAISTAAGNQYTPTIISDDSNGAIITWWDYRSGTNYDIYAQRIDANGALTDPVAISTTPVSVPTMNEWGMMIFMLLAGIGSMYYMRRRA